jgi:hypothetical protein
MISTHGNRSAGAVRSMARLAPLMVFAALCGACSTLAQTPDATGIEPAPSAEAPVNVTLKWPAIPGASAYEVYFGESRSGSNALPLQLRVTRPEFRLETLTAGKEYQWRVAPVVDGKAADAGPVQHFKTRQEASNDENYAWSIKVADTVRGLYPTPEKLGGWNYTEGMTCDALYAIATRTGRDKDVEFVKAWLDRFIKPDGTLSQLD